MSLLNDILQQNNQIAQNPTSVIRTPTQVAYDNLLNRQAEIEKQNKTNGLVGGLMSGIGGLGKIIASAVVKNPFQQAGAMEGLTQQEGRIDQLRQAYENARQTKNRDYIQQAKEQLGMAQADEDKAYNRELTANQIAYKKAQDEIANKLNQDKLDFMKEQADEERKQREITNQRNAENDALSRAYTQAQIDKMKLESNPDYIKQQQEQAQREAEDKQRQAQFKTYVDTAKDLFSKGYLSNEDLIAIEKNPELAEALIPKKRSWLGISIPYTKNPKKMKIDRDSFTIMKDTNGNMAKVYKDGRIEEL